MNEGEGEPNVIVEGVTVEIMISWCDDCGGESVYDLVPDSESREYTCRACGAAVIAEAGALDNAAFA